MANIKVVEYLQGGISVFAKWFSGLDARSAAKVTTALYRLEQGNFSHVNSVGQGVLECKIDFGPGYRVYFGRDGDTLIVLLGGGSKKTQSRDIRRAQSLWMEYKTERNKDN